MSTSSSKSPASNSPNASARKRAPNVIGAVAGAVIGGVLGAIVVKKVRQQGGAKRLLPTKVPLIAKRAASAVKTIAHDAKVAAKATAVVAADTAFKQVKNAAEQFVVDVASGQPPTPPKQLAQPERDEPVTPDVAVAAPKAPRARRSATRKTVAKKSPTATKRSAKKSVKASKARQTR
jgi:hypothetical protein